MPAFATRTVARLLAERSGLQRVELDDGSRAYVLTQLIGPVAAGDQVVVNTTAVDLGLGTGGWHVVHWNLARDTWAGPSGGHIVKLRYTSLQVDTGAAEDDHQELLGEPVDLEGLPVVYCGLHSQVACLAAVIAAGAPGARLAYVMTEAAALPLALSDLVAALEDRGLLQATITAGQAFGGSYEAVNVPSALAVAAAVVGADAVIVGPGPGVVGTGTALGAGAIELAAVVDAAVALGGDAIVALRYSEADGRPRHQGVSRQTLVALGLAARSARLPVPVGPYADRVAGELKAAGVDERHRIELVDAPDIAELLAAADLEVTTMGRDPADDPGFFTVTAAAGAAVARGVAARGLGGSVAGMALFDDASEPRPAGSGPSNTDPDAPGVVRWETPPPPPPLAPSVGIPGEAAAPPELTDPVDPEPLTTAPATGRLSRRQRRRKRKPSTVRSLVEWIMVIGGALLVALLIRTFLLAAYYIPSPSMVATLEEGDRVLVNKLSYHLHGVHRGDIVVFARPPSEPDTGIEDYIKRVIGLPGDVIDLQDCHVTVNGQVLTESYVHDPQGQNCTRPLSQTLPYTVPAGDVWVMGDNRGVSVDSRQFGAIPENSIVGRAFLRIWPLSHLGFL